MEKEKYCRELTTTKKMTQSEREELNTHKGAVIWLTGLSGSGKSTIAQALERELIENNIRSFVLDGDNIRKGLCKDLGFEPTDREENIRRIGEVAKLFCDACIVTIVAFISPYQKDRHLVRERMSDGQFVEIFVDCPVEECEKRDPKGLYKLVRKGEIKNFTGISAPYEAPANPEIHIQTNQLSIEESVKLITYYLHDNKTVREFLL